MHSHACLHKDQKKKREGRITGGVNTSISPTPRTKLDLSDVDSRGTAVAEILLRVKNMLHTCLRCRCLPGCYSPGLEVLKL